jgi:hypothetical protein
MSLAFESASGSMAGRRHTGEGSSFVGASNQDHVVVRQTPDSIVAVVADGCGSGGGTDVSDSHNETAAHVCTWITVSTILRLLSDTDSGAPAWWERIDAELVRRLAVTAEAMFGPEELHTPEERLLLIENNLLCTLVGALVTSRLTHIFAYGDGVYRLNGKLVELQPLQFNEPAYLAYRLLSPEMFPHQAQCRLQVVESVPTEMLRTLLLGTDGVREIVAQEASPIPGTQEAVGPLSQLFCRDAFFQSPVALTLWLRRLNREVIRLQSPASGKPALLHQPGLVKDDVALALIRRKGGSSCPPPCT